LFLRRARPKRPARIISRAVTLLTQILLWELRCQHARSTNALGIFVAMHNLPLLGWQALPTCPSAYFTNKYTSPVCKWVGCHLLFSTCCV
jgi:hypothetical protein